MARAYNNRGGRKYRGGEGSDIPSEKVHAFYHYAFIERQPLGKSSLLASISRTTGRGLHSEIRRYMALGETHPRLKKVPQNAQYQPPLYRG